MKKEKKIKHETVLQYLIRKGGNPNEKINTESILYNS